MTPGNSSIDFSDNTLWRLILTVGMNELRATFCDKNGTRFEPYSLRQWQCDPVDALKNIEDAIYEDPMLLNDYDTTILLRPKMTLIVPPGEFSEDNPEAMAEAASLVDASEHKDVWLQPLGEACALFTTPRGVRDFLSRTFLTGDVRHALCPIVGMFSEKARMEGGEKMWVHIQPEYLDVVAFRQGNLLLANTWRFDHPTDAAYYLLYAWKTLELDPMQGEMSLSGEKKTRDEVTGIMRNYLNYVRLTMFSTTVAAALREDIPLCDVLSQHKNN